MPLSIYTTDVRAVGARKANDHGIPYNLTEEFASCYRMNPLLPDHIPVEGAAPIPLAHLIGPKGVRACTAAHPVLADYLCQFFSQVYQTANSIDSEPIHTSVVSKPFHTHAVVLSRLRSVRNGIARTSVSFFFQNTICMHAVSHCFQFPKENTKTKIETPRAGVNYLKENGVQQLWQSMLRFPAGSLRLNNYPATLRNIVPEISAPDGSTTQLPPTDMAAMEIYRDRERGVPRYNEFRKWCAKTP